MENYIEYMVKKRTSAIDYIQAFLFIIAGFILLCVASFFAILGPFMLAIAVGIVYATYKFVSRINLEYEYLIVNGELDVDKIINRKARKKVESVKLRQIEDFGLCGSEKESRYFNNREYKKLFACESAKEGYAFIVYTKEGSKKILIFTPNDEMIEYIKKVNPGKF